MIGIIGAMEIEVESIKKLLGDSRVKTVSGIDFVSGTYANQSVVTAKCGVGKVFSALCAEAMILEYKPDMIINVGVAGCLSEKLKIGDIVIAEAVVQHDMDTSPLGDPVGMISDINIVEIPTDKRICDALKKSVKNVGIRCETGIIASGDQFVADSGKKKYITENFNAKACEMEGASIGHVCYVNNVPFGVLRAMSDGANDGATIDFPTFAKMAAENSVKVIKEFLSLI